MSEHLPPTTINTHPDHTATLEAFILPQPDEFTSRLGHLKERLSNLGLTSYEESTDSDSLTWNISIEENDILLAEKVKRSRTGAGFQTVKQVFSIKQLDPINLEYSTHTVSGLDEPLKIKRNIEYHEYGDKHEYIEEVIFSNDTHSTNTPYAASQIGLFILIAERSLNRLKENSSER